MEFWCTDILNIPFHECIPRKFNYNEAVAPLKSWILYAFLQPTDWPSKDFGTIINHFANSKLADFPEFKLSTWGGSVHMEFFEAFSKAIFVGKETTPGLSFYPVPENFAILLSRTHLTDEFKWATKFEWGTQFAHQGRQFNNILLILDFFEKLLHRNFSVYFLSRLWVPLLANFWETLVATSILVELYSRVPLKSDY